MYVRTPKKYRGRQTRRVFSCRRLLFKLSIPVLLAVVFAGTYFFLQNSESILPMMQERMNDVVTNMEDNMATINAPTATPTANPAGVLVNADNFWESGSVNEALPLYISVLDSLPNDVTIHTRVVTGLIVSGEIEQALEFAERAVTADPYSSDAWAARAWSLDWGGAAGRALVSALHAEELDPQNAKAVAWLAEAYLSNEQPQRALATAERAIELDPDSPEAYRARGYVYWLGFFNTLTALDDLEVAFELAVAANSPMLGLIAVDIAQISIGNQNFDNALEVLERVLERTPENTAALYWMGSVYFANLGDPSQAASYVTRCVEINPESINCNYLLGRTQMRLEQIDAAAESFVRAINLGSQSARHHWWAANGQVALGRCDRARTYIDAGFPLAQADENTELIEAYEFLMQQCQITPGFSIDPTATPEPEPDPEDSA